jgi:Uncharacterized conserved protein
MAEQITSDKLAVKDVLSKWFRVPEYQRPYVWGNDQVTELLDDVFKSHQSNPDSEYFLGSMVLQKKEKNDDSTQYIEYDLLDGQQRLTTLFLIFAVIRDLTEVSNESRLKSCKEAIYQMANPDYNIPERLRIIFDIRDNVKSFVANYVKADKGTLKEIELRKFVENTKEDISIRNLATAILAIHVFFKGHSVDSFFKYLCTKVLMIYVATEKLDDAFHLFTVMNNRGIKLRNSDILKASNLAKVDANKRTEYAKKWEKIETYFGEDFDNFLSHLRTILVKQKAGYNLLKEFEDNIYAPKDFDRLNKIYIDKKPLLLKGVDTFDFIDKHYENYTVLFQKDNISLCNSYEASNYIAMMSKGFEADFWIPALLCYFDKYKYAKLLDYIILLDNRFSADWLSGQSPTDRIENMNKLISKIDSAKADNPDEVLSSDELTFDKKNLLNCISEKLYGRRFARYILLKLDMLYHGHTTSISFPETISIEHILPQNPDEKSNWVKDFDVIERDIWTDRIGNLVLLSCRKNSSQGNLEYSNKKTKYFKSNVELFSNSIRIYNTYNEWKPIDVKENHQLVITKFLSAYGVTLSKEEMEKLCDIMPFSL